MNRNPTARGKLEIVPAGPEHAAALAEFFRATWSPEASAGATTDGSVEDTPAVPADSRRPNPAWLARIGERVVGYCGSLPFPLWDGSEVRQGYLAKGLWVLPEYRNGPIGYKVLSALAHGLERSAALVVNPAARRLFGAFGYFDYGAIPNYILPLRGGRILARLDVDAIGIVTLPSWMRGLLRALQRSGVVWLFGGIASGVLRGVGVLTSFGVRGFHAQTSDVRPGEADLDALQARVLPTLAAAPVKSGQTLIQRYGAGGPIGERQRYGHVLVRDAAGLIGWAVVRTPSPVGDPRLKGIRVATLSDILFPADCPRAGAATVAAAVRVARRMGADALLATPSHALFRPLLGRRGWVRLPGNIHFVLRDSGGQWPSHLSHWWLHRGDGESDAVF